MGSGSLNPFSEREPDVPLPDRLACWIREYIVAAKLGGKKQEESLAQVCLGIEFLLPDLLDGLEGWAPGTWIDGVVPYEATVNGEYEITIEGYADCIREGSKRREGISTTEPFFGRVRISQAEDLLVCYEFKLADSRDGISNRKRPRAYPPEEWFLVVSSGK